MSYNDAAYVIIIHKEKTTIAEIEQMVRRLGTFFYDMVVSDCLLLYSGGKVLPDPTPDYVRDDDVWVEISESALEQLKSHHGVVSISMWFHWAS